MINHYRVDVSIITNTNDHQQQNVAYERMKYWIHEVMQDSILINEDNDLIDNLAQMDARVLAMPNEPVDQLVGIMLYLKLNAIMEDRMLVTDVEICSSQGDFTTYLHNMKENIGSDLAKEGWWSDSKPTWESVRSRDQGKVVNLGRVTEWKIYDLDWKDPTEAEKDSVVFANFKKDETE